MMARRSQDNAGRGQRNTFSESSIGCIAPRLNRHLCLPLSPSTNNACEPRGGLRRLETWCTSDYREHGDAAEDDHADDCDEDAEALTQCPQGLELATSFMALPRERCVCISTKQMHTSMLVCPDYPSSSSSSSFKITWRNTRHDVSARRVHVDLVPPSSWHSNLPLYSRPLLA